MQNQVTGKQGEQLAKKLLQNKGLTFLTANFRSRYGEIDLVFQDNQEIVFVEVKSRFNFDKGLPEEAVTPSKIRKIRTTAQFFLQRFNIHSSPARIDVVTVDFTQQTPKLEHFINVGW